MLRSIDVSRAGMLRYQQVLEGTAHNVANAATPGFKAVRAALESGDAQAAVDPTGVTGPDTPALSARPVNGRLARQGSIQETGVATDLAISGEGFFVVRRPDGSDGYTRDGRFRADAGGRLADAGGNPLLPALTLPPGATSVRIDASGAVSAAVPGGVAQPVGQIRLARFVNPDGLSAAGDGLFTATAASGLPRFGVGGDAGLGEIRAGALESSNADLTEQMSALVAAQRAYQLNTSAFRMADEMLRMASQLDRG